MSKNIVRINQNFDKHTVSPYNPRPRREVKHFMVNAMTYFFNLQRYYKEREKMTVGYKKKALPALMSGVCRAIMYLMT